MFTRNFIRYSSKQLSVTVEITEGPSKGVYEVQVKEKSPIIVVLFKVARLSGFSLKTTSAIFEVCESLRIRKHHIESKYN